MKKLIFKGGDYHDTDFDRRKRRGQNKTFD